MCARGVLAVHRYLVIMMLGTPRVARLGPPPPPAGPEPTISTSVSTAGPAGISVSAIPSLKEGIRRAPFSGAVLAPLAHVVVRDSSRRRVRGGIATPPDGGNEKLTGPVARMMDRWIHPAVSSDPSSS